jgi:beta-glucosidase
MNLGTLSPTEDDTKIIDFKQATFQVTPVDTVTPSLTPTSPPEGNTMAGKKLYSLEKPDDRAKELASKLTLEEQVCILFNLCRQLCVFSPSMCNSSHAS